MEAFSQFSGSIPAIYDEALGPFLFHWSAEALAERVRVPPDGRVLEVACGTGIATEAMRRALPAQVEIVATDLNESMLARATETRGDLAGTSFRIADAQGLPFDDGVFDTVVCQFGLMFFPDKVAAVREALRVVRPGGQILFSTWDSLEQNPPVRVVYDVLRGLETENPPRFLQVPFGLFESGEITQLFHAAGARNIELEVLEETVELPSAHTPARGLVAGSPGVVELQERGVPIDQAISEAEAALTATFGTAPFRAPLSAIFVNARR